MLRSLWCLHCRGGLRDAGEVLDVAQSFAGASNAEET